MRPRHLYDLVDLHEKTLPENLDLETTDRRQWPCRRVEHRCVYTLVVVGSRCTRSKLVKRNVSATSYRVPVRARCIMFHCVCKKDGLKLIDKPVTGGSLTSVENMLRKCCALGQRREERGTTVCPYIACRRSCRFRPLVLKRVHRSRMLCVNVVAIDTAVYNHCT